MAKGIREYNNKLASLSNTLKMTKTMKMVSASKLRKAQNAQRSSQAYADRLNQIIARLAASVDAGAHPLMTPHERSDKALVLVYTSDKGLCGAFNNSMIRHVEQWLTMHRDDYSKIDLSFCGRRGFMHFVRRGLLNKNYEGVTASPSFADAAMIGDDLIEAYLSGRYDEIYLAYNVFHSPLSQEPTFRKILPIQPAEIAGASQLPTTTAALDYIFEPPQEELLKALIPRTVKFKIYYALLENAAGEHGARMTSMDNATTNCEKMIDHYTLMRNRARQAAITTELIEIISGAEAL